MRLLILFLTTGFLQLSASSYSQTITLKGLDLPLNNVLQAVRQQTGYTVFSTDRLLKGTRPVSVDVKNMPVVDFMQLILKDQPLESRIEGKTISLAKKPASSTQSDRHLETKANGSQPPPVIITGTVFDEYGATVKGITISVKGSSKGVISDAGGRFSINAGSGQTLVFSSVQFETKEIKIISATSAMFVYSNRQSSSLDLGPEKSTISSFPFNISIFLFKKLSPLDEVQVIGYETTTQRTSVGDISTVKAAEIEQQPVSNPLLAMQGRVAGMVISQQSGVPGSSVTVQIRGRSSIDNGTDPLYIIDGVPYTSKLVPGNGLSITQDGSPFNFISTSDIDNVTVLKDADATAIYGSRGANGVVLITTKKGKAGETRVNAGFYVGYGKVTRRANLLSTPQYLEVRKEAFVNDGATPGSIDRDVNGLWDQTSQQDWQKNLIGGTANYSDIQTSVSGGNNITQYFIGGVYHRETPVFPGKFSDKKNSTHFNINSASADKRFKVQLSGNYMSDVNNLMYVDLTQKIFLSPNAPSGYNVDGSLNWTNFTSNPYALLLGKYKVQSKILVANSVLSYKIISNLEAKVNLGYSNIQTMDYNTFPTTSFPPGRVTNGSANFSNSNVQSWIVEPQFTYKKSFGANKINVIAGSTIQNNTTDGEMIGGAGYTNDDLLTSLAAAATLTKGSIINTQYKYNSLFGRISYNHADKYEVTLNGRRDGSSRFGPGKQFANFGSVGAAWIFSNGAFLKKSLSFLSFGKLRSSYGTTGNDQIPDYRYLEIYNFTYASPYQDATGLVPVNLSNPDYAWEVTKKLEGGIELGFFRDRIFLTASYFRNRSSNQLVGYALPDITGFNNILGNLPAVVENKGWEFQLNANIISRQKFKWSASFNLTASRNRLISFPNFETSTYSLQYVIGQPLDIRRVYHLAGVDPETGVYQFKNNKGELTFTPDPSKDNIDIIKTAPKYYGGFQNTLQYGAFQLDVNFQFVKQIGSNFLFTNYYPPGMGFGSFNPSTEVLDRWQKVGDNKPFQKFTQQTGSDAFNAYQYAQNSSYAFSDASFIRLKNLSISYHIARDILKRAHMQSAKIYFQGQNLLTITKFKGLDPENQSMSSLPPLRVLTFGMQITL